MADITKALEELINNNLIHGSDWGGSRISTAQTCKRKHYYEYEYEWPNNQGLGLAVREGKYAPSKGTLIHLGLQCFYLMKLHKLHEGLDNIDIAVKACKIMLDNIPKFNLNEAHVPLLRDELMSSIDQYLKQWASEDIEVLGVEIPIQIKIGEHTHTGIVDLFCRWLGSLYICDHKTTSMQLAMLFKKLRFNLSLKGYARAMRIQTGDRVDALVNGIRFKGTKSLECEFEREPIMYEDAEMAEFEPTVQSVVRELDICREDGFYPKSGDRCIEVWGECDYRKMCLYHDHSMAETFYNIRRPIKIDRKEA